MKIVGMAGSLRFGSYNKALLRTALEQVPDGFEVEVKVFDRLGALPHFDEDIEAAGFPAVVQDLRAAIEEADALLIVTPEYNGGTSGVLKNALDWASRGPVRVLAGKPVAVMGTSTGGGGAQGGIESVVRLLGRTRSDVLEHTVPVRFAADAFDGSSRLVDPGALAEVKEVMTDLVVRAHTAARLAA